MVEVDERACGQVITLQAGRMCEIDLPENPTAGYRWTLTADGASACALVSDIFTPANGTIGRDSRHRWRFQAAQIGQGVITLAYRRSWEQGEARRFTVSVHVVA
ncbi:MAG: protease inhibitor I42 family protein [Chloroflexota bacterium]